MVKRMMYPFNNVAMKLKFLIRRELLYPVPIYLSVIFLFDHYKCLIFSFALVFSQF